MLGESGRIVERSKGARKFDLESREVSSAAKSFTKAQGS